MEKIPFKYIFILPGENQIQIDIQIDAQNLNIINHSSDPLPGWAGLAFFQCPHCPLTITTHTHCPLAANLVNIVNQLDNLYSYHEIQVKVVMKNRTISKKTTVKKVSWKYMIICTWSTHQSPNDCGSQAKQILLLMRLFCWICLHTSCPFPSYHTMPSKDQISV